MNSGPHPVLPARARPQDDPDSDDESPCGHLTTVADGTIVEANHTFLEWTGYSRWQLLGQKRFQDLLPVAGRIFYDTHFHPLLLMQRFVNEIALDIVGASGQRIPILLNARFKPGATGGTGTIRIAVFPAHNRRSYEEELRLAKRQAEQAQAALRQLTEELEVRVTERTQERDRIWRISQDVLAVAAGDGRFISVNPAFSQILGWSEEEARAQSLSSLVHPEQLTYYQQAAAQLSTGQPLARLEILCRHRDSHYRWLSWTIVPAADLLYAVGRDITADREQADALRKAEEALRQAQKMEAIGKLTGGVAHDFNNILQIIGGNLELLKLESSQDSVTDHRLEAAIAAVGRGARLASQLLSFARRQPLQPVPTNLSRILRELDGLLRRALGETIEIETIVTGGLWATLVDPHQLENVILNLAINARDAMGGEGKLTLELSNAMLDEHYAEAHGEVAPGQYVLLAVSDTGSGMPPEVIERAFEPFFTTKREGEGTGLGLSMAYGFVKQSGGHIKIYSELGHGTTFKIYLPRVHQDEIAVADIKRRPVTGGSETVLVVEDDLAVQATTVQILTALGYHVLKANDGQSALSILRSGCQIDLLFTDVVMPGPVKCTELARQARELQPHIKVLFTSGYTQNAIVHGGRLDPGVQLISKPYRHEDLARKVRHVLGGEPAPADRIPPRATPAAPSAADIIAGSPPPEGVQQLLKILVVEDEADARRALCELLALLGHQTLGVATAEEALTALAREPVDVLFTDLSLPGMSGLELARHARQHDSQLTIVLCSGYGEIDTQGLDAHALPKPCSLAQVKRVFAKVKASAARPDA